jgi:DNA-binding MarR family transcriptional regulator
MEQRDESLYRETVQKFLTLYHYLRSYGRQRHEEGISGRKISTLRHLIEAGPLTVGQLSDYLYISDSSTSELIDRLQEGGYVTRARSDVDNRVVLVSVTTAGCEVIQKTPLGGIPLLRERLKQVSPEELAVIHKAVTIMERLLESDHES